MLYLQHRDNGPAPAPLMPRVIFRRNPLPLRISGEGQLTGMATAGCPVVPGSIRLNPCFFHRRGVQAPRDHVAHDPPAAARSGARAWRVDPVVLARHADAHCRRGLPLGVGYHPPPADSTDATARGRVGPPRDERCLPGAGRDSDPHHRRIGRAGGHLRRSAWHYHRTGRAAWHRRQIGPAAGHHRAGRGRWESARP